MDINPDPGRGSFTSAIIWALGALAERQDCFTTLDLLKATMNEAPHILRNQTPVLFDRFYYNSAGRIMLRPLSTHKSVQKPRIYSDPIPQQQRTVTSHFDLAGISALRCSLVSESVDSQLEKGLPLNTPPTDHGFVQQPMASTDSRKFVKAGASSAGSRRKSYVNPLCRLWVCSKINS